MRLISAIHWTLRVSGGSRLASPQRAAFEEMLLDPIRAMDFELGVGPELLEDVLRIALEQPAASGRVARGIGPGAVLIHVQKSVFGIVRGEPETAQAIGMPEAEPVV